MLNDLQRRCVDISYRHKLSHVGSVLNSVDAIADIYRWKDPEEPFVLGNAHAGLALYVVLESLGICDAEKMLEKHGIHSCRDMEHGVCVSGGSLGQAETVAVGLALADRKRGVFLMTSDGACAEGATLEAFAAIDRFALNNISVTIICNGFGAYGPAPLGWLTSRRDGLSYFSPHLLRVPESEHEFLQGLRGHYTVLTKEQYETLIAA